MSNFGITKAHVIITEAEKIKLPKADDIGCISVVLPPKSDAKLKNIIQLLNSGKIVITEEKGIYQTVDFSYPKAKDLIAETLDKLTHLNGIPENGFIYYTGYYIQEGVGEVHFARTLVPPVPLREKDYIFLANYRFITEGAKEALEESNDKKYGIITLDYTGTLLATLKGSHLDVVQRISMQFPRFRSSAHTTTQLYNKLSVLIDQHFIGKDGKPNVIGLIVAGQAIHEALPANLNPNLKAIVMKVIDLEREEEEGLKELLNKLDNVLGHVRLIQEKSILKNFYNLKKIHLLVK